MTNLFVRGINKVYLIYIQIYSYGTKHFKTKSNEDIGLVGGGEREIEMGTRWNVIGRYDRKRDAKHFAKDSNTGEI
jgi:hypothetical protein